MESFDRSTSREYESLNNELTNKYKALETDREKAVKHDDEQFKSILKQVRTTQLGHMPSYKTRWINQNNENDYVMNSKTKHKWSLAEQKNWCRFLDVIIIHDICSHLSKKLAYFVIEPFSFFILYFSQCIIVSLYYYQ